MEAELSLNSVEQSKDSIEGNSVVNDGKDSDQLVSNDKEKNEKSPEISVQQSSPVGNGTETGAFHEVENEANKETYETQFEKFLREANENNVESNASAKDDSREVGNASEQVPAAPFVPTCEDTSNSSWYKIKADSEEKMDTSENVTPPDENSNMSGPDNGSVASSNIGDSCMSFQDQGSNIDEGSNLSIPEENSVPAYTGHQPVFDESANMNPPSNTPFVRPDTPSRPDTPNRPDTPSSITDATCNSESTPVKRYRRGTLQIAAEDASEHGHGLTAADIFEYQWPQEKDSEYFMLQEQISMYLDVKSFKRKYPDLFRRVCDKQEKDFLRDKGVVSETQSDLGLTALKADEVHDLMSRDYPAKYKEFLKILREREKQKMADKMKEFHALKLEKDKMAEYTKKAMKSVSDWNRSLLKKRNEERRAYFDMQTFTIHYPKSKFRKLEQSQTEVSAYPLSLIPGQFQDYYRKYSPEELKYFPLNTSLFDPPKKVDASAEQQVEDDEESQVDKANESGSDSEDSSSSSSDDDEDDDDEEGEKKDGVDDETSKKAKKEKSSSRENSKEKSAEPGIKQENECRICKDESESKRKELELEELITCSECKSKGHPTCLDLNKDMVRVIKTYPWQCMECKTCVQCMDPYDEDKMLFCDKCDRGYHTFCVGLKSLPTGQWDCFSCRGDTTPIKPLPRPTPKAKRGRKPGRPPGRPGRPPGRPPKDPSKTQDSPGGFKRETPGRDRRRKLREENELKAGGGLETPVKEDTNTRDSMASERETVFKNEQSRGESNVEETKSNDQNSLAEG